MLRPSCSGHAFTVSASHRAFPSCTTLSTAFPLHTNYIPYQQLLHYVILYLNLLLFILLVGKELRTLLLKKILERGTLSYTFA
jgi:hypothetical protein